MKFRQPKKYLRSNLFVPIHRDKYVGSLVYRESLVPVPMIRTSPYPAIAVGQPTGQALQD